MPSPESQALYNHFKSLADRMAAAQGALIADMQLLRDMFDGIHTMATEPKDVVYEDTSVPSDTGSHTIPALWIKPLNASKTHVILFTHGGGFVTNNASSHRKMAGHIAKAAGCWALSVDYRVAPEHRWPSMLDDGVSAYHWLRKQGFQPSRIATVGDSAGGNLAIAIPLKLRDRGDPLPAAIVGLSPWTSMHPKGGTMESNAATDPMVAASNLDMMIGIFLDDSERENPLVNILEADPKGLPPMYLACGTHEVLQDNATRWAEKVRGVGGSVECEEAEGMVHVHTFMAGKAREADETIRRVGEFLRRELKV